MLRVREDSGKQSPRQFPEASVGIAAAQALKVNCKDLPSQKKIMHMSLSVLRLLVSRCHK